MQPGDRLVQTIQGRNEGAPLFFPGIYDYRAVFSPRPVHRFGQDLDDFVAATQQEIDLIGSDCIVCGYDIYNVEAEAVGCEIERQPDRFPEVASPLMDTCRDMSRLPALTEAQGRIPLFMEATHILQQRNQSRTVVMGAVSGPFSLAGKLCPQERLLMDCLIDPQGVRALLQYCTELITVIVTQYGRQKTPVVVFDSLAAPPLLSPALYRKLVLPCHRQIFQTLIDLGLSVRPLIIGGDTRALLDDYTQTGANLLLLDFTIPTSELSTLLGKYPGAFRVNLPPQTIADGTLSDIDARTQALAAAIQSHANVMLGTGILPVHTPPPNILQIKKTLHGFWEERLHA